MATPDEITDEDLVARHRGGDPSAAPELWARHHRTIYLQALRRLPWVARGGRPQLAEEVRQEVMEIALRAFDPTRGRSFKAFLKVVLTSRLRDKRRREGKHPPDADADDTAVDSGGSPDRTLEARRWLRRLLRKMEELPADQRDLILRIAEGVKPRDLGESPADAEVMRSRVRRLRRTLAKSVLADGPVHLEAAVYDELFRMILEATT